MFTPSNRGPDMMLSTRKGVAVCAARSYSTSRKNLAKITIHGFPSSQPSRSVLMFCNENKIDYNFVSCNAMKFENLTPEYKILNPAGQVPCIDDNGFVLAESPAILQYLAEVNGLTNWYPTDFKTKAKVNFWMHWHHSHTRLSTTFLLFPAFIVPQKSAEIKEANVLKGKKLVTKSIAFIEERLAANKSKYLVGSERPSIADLLILPELDQLTPAAFDLIDFKPFPHVQAYIDNLGKEIKSHAESFRGACEVAKVLKTKSNVKPL